MSSSLATEWTDLPDVQLGADEFLAGKPLTIWKPSQILEYQEPPGSHLILPAYLTRSHITALIGQGGVGKSRLVLWQGICQIVGRKWCGLDVHAEPQTWLFLGDENSIGRLQVDLRGMYSVLSDSEKARVEEFLRLPAIEGIEDMDLCLRDPTVQSRMSLTIEQHNPDVIVADPLANIAPGDISKPEGMKDAIRLFCSIARKAAPQAAIELLHHARPGRVNIIQGVGYDAANFGAGGKSLFASARCVMNLMPGSETDDQRLVLSCAKSNNCERFTTRGLLLDPKNLTYGVDPDFDLKAWQAEVEGRRSPGQSLCTIADVTSAVQDGYTTTKALVEHLTEACATPKRTVERLIKKAIESEGIKPITRGKFMLGRKSANYLQGMT